MDIVIAELNGPLRVIRNDHASAAAPTKDWLEVAAADRRPHVGNARGVGSVLVVRSKDPDGSERVQRRWIWGGGPFNSTSWNVPHVGIPAGSTAVAVTFTWPDGMVVEQSDVQPGQRLVIERK